MDDHSAQPFNAALAIEMLMIDIYVEAAKDTDAQQILDIQKEAYLSEAKIYDDYNIPPLTQTLNEIKSDFDNHTFYVAKVNGEIVGSVKLKVENNTGLIGRLIVTPSVQNQGVGSMLMGHVEANHSDLEAFELFTGYKSERNLSFYSKRGYLEFKRQVVNEKCMYIFMRKKIAK